MTPEILSLFRIIKRAAGCLLALLVILNTGFTLERLPQPMTDTGQVRCFSRDREISYPAEDTFFFGQDAQYQSHPMAYTDNRDGTVTDRVTGLMWSRAVDPKKVSLKEANQIANRMTLGGYSDWRVPGIKELYSLMNFSGNTGTNRRNLTTAAPSDAVPYINTDYFDFLYGNIADGERYIDAQWLSSTRYVSTTMNGNPTLFGVNFADGRIKGYGYQKTRGNRREKKFYVRYVRGTIYGVNDFIDNGDGTVTDRATGLVWMKADSGRGMTWDKALAYAQNWEYAGHNDWRLPDAKELQFIVDYTRSPDTTSSPAIDPVFETTPVTNEKGETDFPYFWTSTTHADGPKPAGQAVYIAFGRGMGKMHGIIMDVHGAGCQRSDPKSGRGGISRGPQGDFLRVNNFVRLVRGGSVSKRSKPPVVNNSTYPYKITIAGSDSYTPYQKESSLLNADDSQHGVYSAIPLVARDQKMERPGFVNRLDHNGDNRVSPDEFDGPSSHFTRFDLNRDGFITEDETPKGPPGKGNHLPGQ
jgi:hypothetical protein